MVLVMAHFYGNVKLVTVTLWEETCFDVVVDRGHQQCQLVEQKEKQNGREEEHRED